ncbi:hypothetical protein DL96DRAFT_1820967 [Flagelloscypha sp. PMI_526]|nr:hypothetical protein DL96DRAFT_1820967 [Flagelloscypha sp. PMI_526]
MPRRPAVVVPAEIWLEIAAYLSQWEIQHLSSLCRPYRQLWVERKRQRFALPTISNVSGQDWRAAAYIIWRALHARIESGDAAHTKSIVFYSTPYTRAMKPPSLFSNILRSVGSGVRHLLFTSWLPLVYRKYVSVDSLAFLHQPTHMPSGPYCYLSVSSIWSTFSSNLRELAISVSYSKALADLLPSQTRPLPKLEVMRMGYLYRPWVSHPTEVGHSDLMLERLAQLYTNQALQVLELQILYPRQLSSSGGPSLAESLLPKRHIFPQLRSFWIITKRANIDPTQTSHISSFIRAHASTLRSLKIHKFQAVIKDLFVNTPNFPLQPSFSIAFNNIAVLSLNPSALTKITLIELQMPFICRLPPHCPFQDLLRLQICVNTIRLDCFDQWAKQLPQLISLSVRYWEEDSNITTKISSRITNNTQSYSFPLGAQRFSPILGISRYAYVTQLHTNAASSPTDSKRRILYRERRYERIARALGG